MYFWHLNPQEQHYLRLHPNRELREFFIEQALLGPLSLGQISATEANFLNRLVRANRPETVPLSKSGRCSVSPRESSRAPSRHTRNSSRSTTSAGTRSAWLDTRTYSITSRRLANATRHLNIELVREDKALFHEQAARPPPRSSFSMPISQLRGDPR